jgi:hypothetical protein
MANIFNFPTKKGDTSKEGFLQEASELVQFDATGRDVDMSDVQIPEHLLPCPNDWTNQELASIYRVKRLLDAAGVPNHVERSLSDEGDPWCVFCTQTGDVFIHLCRLDGLYVLDSPNLAQPIKGSDFTDLIGQFSEGALRNSEKAAQARRRLIKLERGGKVFLHPSVLLAALIWSIYLNSEDLVLFMPEEGEDGFDSDAAAALLAATADSSDPEDIAAEAHFTQSIATPDKIIATQSPASDSEGWGSKATPFYKDVSAKAGMAMMPSAIAVGLSSIAIAYGFMSDTYFEDDAPIQAELSLGQDGELQVVAEGASDIQTPRAETPFDLAAVLDAVFDHQDPGQAGDDVLPVTESSAQIDVASLLEVALKMPETLETGFTGPNAEALLDESLEAGQKVALVMPQKLATPESDSPVLIITAETPNEAGTALPDILPLPSAVYSLADLRDSFSGQLLKFMVGDTTIEASFDLASLSDDANRMIDAALDLDLSASRLGTDVAAASPDPLLSATSDMLTSFFQRPSGGTLINEDAINFVLYMMDKANNVQIISRGNEITLIDFDAFQPGQGEYYAMSWTLEHGGTVQTIGLKADFMEFDLIA